MRKLNSIYGNKDSVLGILDGNAESRGSVIPEALPMPIPGPILPPVGSNSSSASSSPSSSVLYRMLAGPKKTGDSPPSIHAKLSTLTWDNKEENRHSHDQFNSTTAAFSPARLRSTSHGDMQYKNVTSESPYRLRSLSNLANSLTGNKKQASMPFIYMLPDPACLVNERGQIGQLNAPFERVFKEVLSHSLSVFDYMEPGVEAAVRDTLNEVSTSILPQVKQVRASDGGQSDSLVWTVSSMGFNPGSGLGSQDFLLMYSRPAIRSTVSDLGDTFQKLKQQSSVDTVNTSADGSSVYPDPLSPAHHLHWGSSMDLYSLQEDEESGSSVLVATSDRKVGPSHALLLSADGTGDERFNRRFTHEIRTPLHIILNNLSMLDQNAAEVQETTRNALDLKGILDDYSFMSQAELHELSQLANCADMLVKTTLSVFVESVAYNCTRNLLYSRRFRFSFDDEDTTQVLVDKVYLERILTHLFTNAAKYSSDGSVIPVTVSRSNDNDTSSSTLWDFRVSNSCLEEFKLADISASLNSSLSHYQSYISEKESGEGLAYSHGLGFGLAVATNMVKCLGGRLSCSYAADDCGGVASFYFSIPLETVQASSSQEDDEYIPLISPDVTDRQQAQGITSRPTSSMVARRRSLCASGSVLVVDDSAVCRKVMVSKLSEAGFTCDVATNGLEACTMLEHARNGLGGAGRFDAVLMDLHMPQMDGIEATRYIRHSLRSDIPILVLSAEQGDSKMEALACGANAYMDKPAVAADVIAKLRSLLSRQQSKNN